MSDMTVCPVASRQSFFDSFTVVSKAIGQLEKLMSGKVSRRDFIITMVIDNPTVCKFVGLRCALLLFILGA